MSEKEKKFYRYCAGGKATTCTLTQVVNGELVTCYVGKVRSVLCVDLNGNYKFLTKEKALQCARDFIQRCKDRLKEVD